MAFTRKFLKGIGLNEDQIESVMDEHVSVTDALKTQINTLKEDANELDDLKKEVTSLRQFKADAEKGDWENKFNSEHKAFEEFKADTAEQDRISKIKSAYTSILKEASIDDKRFDAILKVTDFSNMKLDKEGKLVDADKLAESAKAEWAGFIVTQRTEGQKVSNPPANQSKGQGDNAQYIRDRMAQRNANLFGEKKGE